jgi:hypothetical protein
MENPDAEYQQQHQSQMNFGKMTDAHYFCQSRL